MLDVLELGEPIVGEPVTLVLTELADGGAHDPGREPLSGRSGHVPGMTAQRATHQRHLGLDVARGLALLAMFVAHTAPWSGVWGNGRNLADSVTAPLFATLIGAGLYLSAQRDTDGGPSLVSAGVRAWLLVVVGAVLLWMPAQVDVVLVHLGVLTIVAALLVKLPALWPGLTVLALVVAWPLVDWGQERVHGILRAESGTDAFLINIAVGGTNYRLVSMLVWAMAGMAFARHLLTASTRTHGLLAGAGGLTAVLGVLVHHAGWVNLAPYTGYPVEVLFDGFLAVAVVSAGCVVAAGVPKVADALAVAGRATLSVYAAHIIFLAVWVTSWGNATDDSWWALGILVVFGILLPAAWAGSLPGRGPLELGFDWAASLAARTVATRPAPFSGDWDPDAKVVRFRRRKGPGARAAVTDER